MLIFRDEAKPTEAKDAKASLRNPKESPRDPIGAMRRQERAKGSQGKPERVPKRPKGAQRQAKGTPERREGGERDAKGTPREIKREAKGGQREAKGRPRRGLGFPENERLAEAPCSFSEIEARPDDAQNTRTGEKEAKQGQLGAQRG